MKIQKIVFLAGLLSFVSFCPSLHAVVYPNPLATSSRTVFSVPSGGNFYVRMGQSLGLGIGDTIFDNLTLTTGSVGQTFYITQGQDTDFNAVVAVLQNGQNNAIAFEYSFQSNFSSISGVAQDEALFFAPLPAGNNGIDFQGFPIDNIALRVDSATPAGPNNFDVHLTVLINSAPVPEPATGTVAFLGVAAWAFLARKRKG